MSPRRSPDRVCYLLVLQLIEAMLTTEL